MKKKKQVVLEFRRRLSSDVWHYNEACSHWPARVSATVRVQEKKPTTLEFCNECRAKSKRGLGQTKAFSSRPPAKRRNVPDTLDAGMPRGWPPAPIGVPDPVASFDTGRYMSYRAS